MADPGFVSGFIGLGINKIIDQIIDRINIAVRCKKEMASLKDLVVKIKPIITEIQQYRPDINRKKKDKASAVNGWLKQLDALLQQASKMVQTSTIPTCNIISRYQTSLRIRVLISEINEHIKFSPLVELALIPELLEGQTQKLQEEIMQIKESREALASSSTSHGPVVPTGSAKMKLIEEPLIVGQDKAFSILEKLVLDVAEAKSIGVVGKGGSGKTLLLKTLFSSQKVRSNSKDHLLLWLTVSQSPSFTSLRNALRTQIAAQKNVNLGENMNEEEVKLWLNHTLQESTRFIMFLDDVWGWNAAELLEELGVLCPVRNHSTSKVIVSSRDRAALLRTGVADKYTITMEDLLEDESWKLFAYHTFPYNNGNLPSNIEEGKAKVVCKKCRGLPLAIKVVGRAMAGSTHPQQWEWAVQRLPNVDGVYNCVRLSYDALGYEDANLQLCFLSVAANILEDAVVHVQLVIQVWIGEGLLAKKTLEDEHRPAYDPFELGRYYLNILADRCLIEPMMRDFDGQVLCFRVHDSLRDMAIRIAEEEENFYCRAGKGLTALNENECLGRTRLLLSENKLTSFPLITSSTKICTLFLSGNPYLTKIPTRLIRRMISLKAFSLSGTSLKSLPKNIGCLEQLISLGLRHMPINRLPASFTSLVNLEILDLAYSGIQELPSTIHMLRSLRKLSLEGCKDLQYLPLSISRLTSLEHLETYGCKALRNKDKHTRWTKAASVNNLASLTQLKRLQLQNNGEIISDGTLGKMTQMNSLTLSLTKMQNLPHDISNMSKLRRLVLLDCFHLVKMDYNFYDFQYLGYLKFASCHFLEELPHLHKLKGLRHLEIIDCPRVSKFPIEFGHKGAFPLLETFSLAWLPILEELPMMEEGAMASLKIFTIMACTALNIFPKSYMDLKTLQKVRVYGCPITNIGTRGNTIVEVTAMSIVDMEEITKRYSQLWDKRESWLYGEFWCNELFLFLRKLNTII